MYFYEALYAIYTDRNKKMRLPFWKPREYAYVNVNDKVLKSEWNPNTKSLKYKPYNVDSEELSSDKWIVIDSDGSIIKLSKIIIPVNNDYEEEITISYHDSYSFIRNLRKNAGLSRYKLADIMNINVMTVTRIENEKYPMRIFNSNRIRILNYFGYDVIRIDPDSVLLGKRRENK